MLKKVFAEDVLDCSYSQLRAVLAGERNFSLEKARIVARLSKTPIEVWLDRKFKAKRRQAWKKILRKR